MERLVIKENILRQIELIIEQNQNLNAYSGKIPQIDIDIIKGNIRKLYEQFFDLEKTNLITDVVIESLAKDIEKQVIAEIRETPEKPLIIINEPIAVHDDISIIEEELQDEKEEVDEEHIKIEEVEVIFMPEPKAIIEEKIVEINEESVKETIKNVEDKQKAAIKTDLFGNATNTIADKYKNEAKSLNDRMQKNKTEKTIGAKMFNNPIKDLKSAIGINEKFLFINELFKGNMKAYNDSIIALNDSESHDKAVEYLEILRNNYKWEVDMVAFLTLKDFVERKHLT